MPRNFSLTAVRHVEVTIDGRNISLEYAWTGPAATDLPVLVFLHEGLGCLEQWKHWPARVCAAAGCRGLMFSRRGYGSSTALLPGERRPADYLRTEARDVLPAFLESMELGRRPVLLYGHSDGGSIALLYAAHYPDRVSGIVVAAPHIFVEDATLAGIRDARTMYETTGLRQMLARYHSDADSMFYGWNDAWLHPAYRQWNIEADVGRIQCPILAIQGAADEYASMEQIHGIRRLAPQTQCIELADCGHSPHKDQPGKVIDAVAAFAASLKENAQPL